MQPQLHYQQIQKQQLQAFWTQQMQEMEQVNGMFFTYAWIGKLIALPF